jgi:hypothetical protein
MERPDRGDKRRWVPAQRRDPHTILRIDTLNDRVLMKYSDRTTEWDEGEYYMAHTEAADG